MSNCEGHLTRTAHLAVGIGIVALVTLSLVQAAVSDSVKFTGVNISGAEFAPSKIPGEYNRDYTFPDPTTINYYSEKGMNIIRMPVLWERLQSRLEEPLSESEMQRIDSVVGYATSKAMKIIIDVHNYAAYFGKSIGTRETPRHALGNLWRQIALRYKENDSVIFGLMNEPTGLPTETWLDAANIAIAEIRQVGAKNLILVPGNGWSSARDWMSSEYGTPNSQMMLNIIDPIKNSAFEVHQYFNRDFTGAHADCRSVDVGVESLVPFTNWAREHHQRGFLGEFGAGSDSICIEALDRVLEFMAANDDVWLGWTYWAAGAWWPKEYFTNLDPSHGKDRPQMSVLEKYLSNSRKFGNQ